MQVQLTKKEIDTFGTPAAILISVNGVKSLRQKEHFLENRQQNSIERSSLVNKTMNE